MENQISSGLEKSLDDYKKKAINLLINNSVNLEEQNYSDFNNFLTKEEVIKYTNLLLNKKNSNLKNENNTEETTPKSHDNINNQENNKLKEGGNVEIIETYTEHIKKREISDFVMHYNNRFKDISVMLRKRDLDNLTSINIIKELKTKEEVSTIAIIFDIKESKNGHIILELEDKTGIIKGLVMKTNEELYNFAKNLVLDEVVAIKGAAGNDIIFISEIILPDIPLNNVIKQSPKEEYAVVIGDSHIGSNVFYNKEFQEFVSWISGEKTPKAHKKIVEKIKYLIIPGDIVEGVGIFPGQEKELEKTSIEEQYNLFCDYIDKIPKEIQIILCPGNHDAVRIAEPQPPFEKKYIGRLSNYKNVHLISSPGMVNIGKTTNFEGFNVLLYHGFSMPYYGDKVPEIRDAGGLSNMSAIMKFYLQRRHFAPTHGSTQFVPDVRYDPLVINKIPDFLITGHVHKISVDMYKGVTIINASTWVAQSEYQSRFGLVPDPCRAILINLKNRDVKILNFEGEKDV